MKFRNGLFGAAAALALAAGGYAVAQVTLPQVPTLGPGTDLVQVIPNGSPHAGNQYAVAGLIGSDMSVSTQVPLTAFAITVPNNIGFLFLNPAGTLGTGTITFPAGPGDGQSMCWESTQTQTAVTMTANTGQSIAGALGTVSAGVAATPYCWRYLAAKATWYRYL